MDLTLEVVEETDGLRLAFEYSTDLFDEVTIAAWADHLETSLVGAVANPSCPVAALSLLADDERRRLRRRVERDRRRGSGGDRRARARRATSPTHT